jgi:hypothetical protein
MMWGAVDNAPELAELVQARAGGFEHTVDDRATVHDYLEYLREASFAEAGSSRRGSLGPEFVRRCSPQLRRGPSPARVALCALAGGARPGPVDRWPRRYPDSVWHAVAAVSYRASDRTSE